MSDTPALGLPLMSAEQAQKHVTHNEALQMLDAVVQLAVLDRDMTAAPAAPPDGGRYIIASGATGAWAGRDLDIAAWQDGAWDFLPPREGWLCWVRDEDICLVFDGAAWVPFGGGGAAGSELQNLTRLGFGTAADAINPFSAKLNKALWTARTAAEGGDGDLRYTLNKETAADVLSLLFQTGFSGRAEFGLIGDDKITLKMSADGVAWTNAAAIDGQGTVTLPRDLVVDDADSLLVVDSVNNRVVFSSSGAGPSARTNVRATGGADKCSRHRRRGHDPGVSEARDNARPGVHAFSSRQRDRQLPAQLLLRERAGRGWNRRQ